ncbi:hypothetical protein Gotur_033678, partial [Gossypium turneri]
MIITKSTYGNCIQIANAIGRILPLLSYATASNSRWVYLPNIKVPSICTNGLQSGNTSRHCLKV